MTFSEWWKQVEGWKTEGGSGEHKARAAWEYQQRIIGPLLASLQQMLKCDQLEDAEGPIIDAAYAAIVNATGTT